MTMSKDHTQTTNSTWPQVHKQKCISYWKDWLKRLYTENRSIWLLCVTFWYQGSHSPCGTICSNCHIRSWNKIYTSV